MEEIRIEKNNDVMGWDDEEKEWVWIGSLDDCEEDVPELDEMIDEICEEIESPLI